MDLQSSNLERSLQWSWLADNHIDIEIIRLKVKTALMEWSVVHLLNLQINLFIFITNTLLILYIIYNSVNHCYQENTCLTVNYISIHLTTILSSKWRSAWHQNCLTNFQCEITNQLSFRYMYIIFNLPFIPVALIYVIDNSLE